MSNDQRALTTQQVKDDSSFTCCRVRIDALTLEGAVEVLRHRAESNQATAVHLCNAYTLSVAKRSREYADLLNASDFNLADGAPVAWMGRHSGFPEMAQPVRGPSLMASVMDEGRKWGARHFLYGSTPETVAQLQRSLERCYPGVAIVGAVSPPFRPLTHEEEVAITASVLAARPHYVWVGLGTPKQDEFVARFTSRMQTTLIAIGAAFDFLSGTKKEAPAFLQGTGLEWVYRLGSEPRRLWRRYLVGNPVFLAGAFHDLRRRSAQHG